MKRFPQSNFLRAGLQHKLTVRIDIELVTPLNINLITAGSTPGATTKSNSNCRWFPEVNEIKILVNTVIPNFAEYLCATEVGRCR